MEFDPVNRKIQTVFSRWFMISHVCKIDNWLNSYPKFISMLYLLILEE